MILCKWVLKRERGKLSVKRFRAGLYRNGEKCGERRTYQNEKIGFYDVCEYVYGVYVLLLLLQSDT